MIIIPHTLENLGIGAKKLLKVIIHGTDIEELEDEEEEDEETMDFFDVCCFEIALAWLRVLDFRFLLLLRDSSSSFFAGSEP